MKNLSVLSLAIALFCNLYLLAADKDSIKVTGWVSDLRCGAKGASTSHEECLRQCLHNGDKLTLVADKDHRLLLVENPEALKGNQAHHVAVTGHVDTIKSTIHVDRVEMLEGN